MNITFMGCFLLAALLGWAAGMLVGWGKRAVDRAALQQKYGGIKVGNVRVIDSAAGSSDAGSKKQELLLAAKRVVQYVLYQVYLSEQDDDGRLIDQWVSDKQKKVSYHHHHHHNKGGKPTTCTKTQHADMADLLRQYIGGGKLGGAITASLLPKYSTPATKEAAVRERLFPGNGKLYEYKRDPKDPSQKNVVARNHEKGRCYEVCLDADPADPGAGLNKVEHVVSVLLHEVAHTIHLEHCKSEVHNRQFQDLYEFLVDTARCVLTKDDAPLTTGSITFDLPTFEASCGEDNSISFCGVTVPLSRCDGNCAYKGKKDA